jgi:hypothetical protein
VHASDRKWPAEGFRIKYFLFVNLNIPHYYGAQEMQHMNACMNVSPPVQEKRAERTCLQRQFLNSVIITAVRDRIAGRGCGGHGISLSERASKSAVGKQQHSSRPRSEHVNKRHDEFLYPCIKCSTDVNFYKAKLSKITATFLSVFMVTRPAERREHLSECDMRHATECE